MGGWLGGLMDQMEINQLSLNCWSWIELSMNWAEAELGKSESGAWVFYISVLWRIHFWQKKCAPSGIWAQGKWSKKEKNLWFRNFLGPPKIPWQFEDPLYETKNSLGCLNILSKKVFNAIFFPRIDLKDKESGPWVFYISVLWKFHCLPNLFAPFGIWAHG